MRLKRFLVRLLLALLALVATAALAVVSAWVYAHPKIEAERGVVYGRRLGHDLTVDVFRPAHPNGAGVLLMVSGGWRSRAGSFDPWLVAPLLRRGYAIFAVYHVSQPEATVMEISEDVTRAVRFVRHNAGRFGVDPLRLGVAGGSAGGHLGLMLATRGRPGPADAPDPVDRESAAVQSAAVFYPVTDLLNLGPSTENLHDGGPPKSYVQAFGAPSTNPAVWRDIGREMSPLHHITTNLPPILIYHGDADTLVPLEQSQRFQAEARRLGKTVELVVHPGGRHGWPSMIWDIRKFADWFDRTLPPARAPGGGPG